MKYRTAVKCFDDYHMHYLEVPKKEIKRLGGKFRLRLVCKLNGKMSFRCGLMALGGGLGFVMLSKRRMKDLGVESGQKVQVELKPDTSKYGMEMPAELKEVLKQDPEGKARFDSLQPGKQRTLLFHVGSAKNEDKRIERALLILENLKQLPKGKETIPAIFGKRSQAGSGRW